MSLVKDNSISLQLESANRSDISKGTCEGLGETDVLNLIFAFKQQMLWGKCSLYGFAKAINVNCPPNSKRANIVFVDTKYRAIYLMIYKAG